MPKSLTRKFDARTKKIILVGYDGESTNYRLYHPDTNKVTVSRNVIFRECVNGGSYSSETTDEEDWLEEIQNDQRDGNVELRDGDVEQPVEGAAQADGNIEQQGGNSNDVAESPVDNVEVQNENAAAPVNRPYGLRDRARLRRPGWSFEYELDFAEYSAPKSFDEAISGPDAAQWKQAIQEELSAHEKNRTWEIVSRDQTRKAIDSKWVFKAIQNPDGSVRRYKAILCARGFLLERGVDFEETFSPVVRYDSLRVLLATVTQEDLEMVQFDVCTAFLYGNLQEEVHMKIPVGLNVEKNASEVECRLRKSLYGLKQAPRC